MTADSSNGRYALFSWEGSGPACLRGRSPCLHSLCALASELPWILDWQILDFGQRHRPVLASSPVRIKEARGLLG